MWQPTADQLSDLLAALADAERVVGRALARTAARHAHLLGPRAVHMVRQEFQPARATWWAIWWIDLPRRAAPYEELRCDLDLSPAPGRAAAELCGWIDLWRYVGRGETADDEVWRSAAHLVASPAAAAAAARGVAADLAERLGRLDLGPYLGGGTAGPVTAADPPKAAGSRSVPPSSKPFG